MPRALRRTTAFGKSVCRLWVRYGGSRRKMNPIGVSVVRCPFNLFNGNRVLCNRVPARYSGLVVSQLVDQHWQRPAWRAVGVGIKKRPRFCGKLRPVGFEGIQKYCCRHAVPFTRSRHGTGRGTRGYAATEHTNPGGAVTRRVSRDVRSALSRRMYSGSRILGYAGRRTNRGECASANVRISWTGVWSAVGYWCR